MGSAVEMVLTGPSTGRSLTINHHVFRNGVANVYVEPYALDAFLTVMARSYRVFRRGSPELAIAQEQDRANGVLGDFQADSSQQNGASASVPSACDNGSGPVSETRALRGDGHAGGETGSEGMVPVGPGYQNAGMGNGMEPRSHEQPDAIVTKIRVAVEKLDYHADDHWTTEGLPAVDAIAQITAEARVTRDMIESSCPGRNRQKAEDQADLSSL